MTTKKAQARAIEKLLAPFNARERAALGKLIVSSPRIKVSKTGDVARISPDHPNDLIGQAQLLDALGARDSDFLNGLLGQLAKVGSQGSEYDESKINFMLSVIKGVKPRDQIVTMLAAQMTATHMASMTFASRLAHAQTIEQQDSAERAFTKLTRTFAMQMEALKRYLTGGEQKVTVQHVSVGEGGQAIVGNVTQASRETTPAKVVPLALPDARTAPMPIIEDSKERAPVPARRRTKHDG